MTQADYWTWSHVLPHMRDSNVRDQQLTLYGSYDLPFGKGKQFTPGANHADRPDDWRLSVELASINWSGGLPFTSATTTVAPM